MKVVLKTEEGKEGKVQCYPRRSALTLLSLVTPGQLTHSGGGPTPLTGNTQPKCCQFPQVAIPDLSSPPPTFPTPTAE